MSVTEHFMKGFLNVCHRPNIDGLDKINFAKKTILMPNHVSLLDALLLAFHLPKNVCFVVNSKIADRYQFILKNRKHIKVDTSNPYSVREMIDVVEKGSPLVIFPEGRISTTGNLMKIYDGLSYIGLKTGANIHPVIIAGAERSYYSYIPDIYKQKRFPKISIRIGEPFNLQENEEESPTKQKEEASRILLRKMQNEMFLSRHSNGQNIFDEVYRSGKVEGMDKVIVEDPISALSYKELLMASYAFANNLEGKLHGNKRIGVFLPNSTAFPIATLALFKLGKTPALLNFSMGAKSLMDCCETGDVNTIITSKSFIEKAELGSTIEALGTKAKIIYMEDVKETITKKEKLKALVQYKRFEKADNSIPEVLLFTSGSENKPKGVLLSHDNILANIQQVTTMIDVTPKDILFNSMPTFHSFGFTAATMLPLIRGIKVFFYPSPLHYKEIPELAYQKNATLLFGTSTFFEGYGKHAHPYDFYSLRYGIVGAEKLKDSVRNLWNEKFGIRILEGYGATETAPVISLNTPLMNRSGTVGQFLPGIEYKLQQEEGIKEGGSLLVKGPNIMKGYLIHNEGFKPADEWYNLGDVVSIDQEGYISIKSRLKRFAKIAGEMVSLNLVENMASRCYEDACFAAVNVPDKRKGERIILYTTREDIKLKEFKKFIKDDNQTTLLAPSKIVVVEELPLLGTGKFDYVQIKEWAKEVKTGLFSK